MQRNHTHIQQAPPLQIPPPHPAPSGKERNHHSGTVNYSKQWRYPWQPKQKLLPVGCLSRVVCFCQSCMFNLCLENIMWDMHKVCVCLAVACHLHFWQNDLGLLHATVITWEWNGYWSQSQHRKLTMEKILLLQAFQLWVLQSTTEVSRVANMLKNYVFNAE